MTAERWTRIKEAFNTALELPEAERDRYLQSCCGDDGELRDEVERMLKDSAGESLSSPSADLLSQLAEPAAGDMLGHYQIEAKLGEGGMGTVYRAFDTRLERRVALKVLRPDPFFDPGQTQLAIREARAASALNHPNIVTVYEIGSERGLNYIAMECVEGRSLASLIPSAGLPYARALAYAVQIANALAHAHSAGIVHRDLKPGNVMVNSAGQVKLLDFGLARKLRLPGGGVASLTIEGPVAGTPAYMAPEQAEGKKNDERADVFAFGAVLYEMLSGRRAFQGSSTLAVLGAVLREEPPRLPGIPREVERILGLCLRKDPERRLRNIGDVRLQLEAAGEPDPAPGPPKRRRWLVPAALLAILAVSAAVFTRLSHREPASQSSEMLALTSDPGLSFQPAISPDGKLLAFSSDRGGGNLDIWVQHVAGGDPIQLTRDPADDSWPAFSPDGSRIAFRSERGGGGVYVVSALGGEPRLIAPLGRFPKFSPDGSQIAFSIGKGAGFLPGLGLPAVFVVSSGGGRPRRLQSGLKSASVTVWAPDGKHVICRGVPQRGEADWWIVPLGGGPALRTRAHDLLSKHGLWRSSDAAEVWFGNRLIFSHQSAGGIKNLWEVAISSKTWEVAGPPRRLTFGTGTNIQASVSAGGQVVFASTTVNRNVWSLAVDADRGRVTGELRRLTREANSNRDPVVSPDGRKVAFVAGPGPPTAQVRIRDAATGKEAPLSGVPAGVDLAYPSFSPDGSRVVFRAWENSRPALYVVPATGGMAERICESCGNAPAWSRDASKIAYDHVDGRRYVGFLDTATGANRRILARPDSDLLQPQFSPGDRWISFVRLRDVDRTHVMVAPFGGAAEIPESAWIPVTDGSGFDTRPRWSPDGNLLYFISDRDGFRCIWAQRLNPATGHAAGASFAVCHFHDPRRLLSDTPELGLSVARDKMVFNLIESTGNIWTFRLPGNTSARPARP